MGAILREPVQTNQEKISAVQDGKSVELELIDPKKEELELALTLTSLEVFKVYFTSNVTR